MGQQEQTPVIHNVHRLTPAVYDQLVKLCLPPTLDSRDPQSAAYRLGQQSVLQMIREGIVAE